MMSFLYLILTVSLLAVSTIAQGAITLTPGIWGGHLVYSNQTTDFFLEFRYDNDKNITAYLTLPITNFHDRPLGLVEMADSGYKVSSMQFALNESGDRITGSIKIYSGLLTFELSPNSNVPLQKAHLNMVSTASPDWTYLTGGPVWGDAATDGVAAFIGSTDGNLYSIDIASGEMNWAHKTDGAIYSRPLPHDDYIYVLVDDGFLYKINRMTAERIWMFDTESSDWKQIGRAHV